MNVRSLGHVVLKVRDQERSEAFYHGVLGLPIAGRMEDEQMTFFSLGNHHDFAIAAVGDEIGAPPVTGVGIDHVAFKVGDTLADLRAAKAELEGHGVRAYAIDHGVTHSLYCSDPDGHLIELYVDASDDWKRDPALVAQPAAPLEL